MVMTFMLANGRANMFGELGHDAQDAAVLTAGNWCRQMFDEVDR
jgi:hypothetical protein